MKNMSAVYEFVKSLPLKGSGKGFVEKRSTARDMIMQLPSPTNMARDPDLIPDVDVSLFLSTGKRLPAFISQKIMVSEEKGFFRADSLLGLCLNGRGLPVQIFLNGTRMQEMDPSGNLFEEVTWHEMVHGIEGIEKNADNKIIRTKPWSYAVQNAMLQLDFDQNQPPLDDEGRKEQRQYLKYLREGTGLQENVSEIFARVAVLYMLQIREKSVAPVPDAPPDFAERLFESTDIMDRVSYNLTDLFDGLSTFGTDAQSGFWHLYPEAIKRVSKLYGCVAPA